MKPPTSDDFRATLSRLGLSQAALVRLLDLDKNTPNRWAQGTSPPPKSVVLLLRLLEDGRVTWEELERLAH